MRYCKLCHRLIPDNLSECAHCAKKAGRSFVDEAIEIEQMNKPLSEAFKKADGEPKDEKTTEIATAEENKPAKAVDKEEDTDEPKREEKAEKESTEKKRKFDFGAVIRQTDELFEGLEPTAEEPEQAKAETLEDAFKGLFRHKEKEPENKDAVEDKTGETKAKGKENKKLNQTLFDLDMSVGEVKVTAKKRTKAENDGTGELEKEVIEKLSPEEENNGGRYTKLTISLVALLIAVLLGLGIYAIAAHSTGKSVEVGDDLMLEYLCGEWLSDKYSYADEETAQYRELLTINENGTYTIQFFIINDNPTGYLDGSWQVENSMSGIVAFKDEDSSVNFINSEKGRKYEYIRYLINTDKGTMTLREYYDEKKTDYYDVQFTKLSEK